MKLENKALVPIVQAKLMQLISNDECIKYLRLEARRDEITQVLYKRRARMIELYKHKVL